VTEFLAIGVHREGFLRYDKYGQLVVVPFWLPCVVGILTLSAVRERTVLGAAAGAAASSWRTSHCGAVLTAGGR
jgi:hypothetical protein